MEHECDAETDHGTGEDAEGEGGQWPGEEVG